MIEISGPKIDLAVSNSRSPRASRKHSFEMDRARIVIKSGEKLSQAAEGNPLKPCQSKILEKRLGPAFRWTAWVASTLPPVLV